METNKIIKIALIIITIAALIGVYTFNKKAHVAQAHAAGIGAALGAASALTNNPFNPNKEKTSPILSSAATGAVIGGCIGSYVTPAGTVIGVVVGSGAPDEVNNKKRNLREKTINKSK